MTITNQTCKHGIKYDTRGKYCTKCGYFKWVATRSKLKYENKTTSNKYIQEGRN